MSRPDDFIHLFTQGLPFILIILYFLFPEPFSRISQHPLGKFIAVMIVVIYTNVDMTLGFFVCLLVIMYYQYIQPDEEEGFLTKVTQEYADYLPKSSLKNGGSGGFLNRLEKDFTPVNVAYPSHALPPIRKVSESLFRKEFCHPTRNRVTFKDQEIKTSMIRHVHPELKFREDAECNPCDKTCHFTVNRKHDLERQLRPKCS